MCLVLLVLSACSIPQTQPSLTPKLLNTKPLFPTDKSYPSTNTPVTPSLASPSPISEPPFSILEGKADAASGQIHYICFGEGSPTIILDSGFAMDWSNWESVMQEISHQTRICAYDRPGLGKSYRASASNPRTSLDMAADLNILLTNAGLPGPYILVGHSAGAFNALVYANQYPQDMVGIVLVDPCNPDIFQQMLDSLPPETTGEPSEVAKCRHNLKDALVFLQNPYNAERWDFVTSFEQVRAIRSLYDLPLIVITDLHDTICRGELRDNEDQIWTSLHANYAALSTNGTQVITNSGHILSITNPQAVIDAILQVLEQVRSK